MPRADSHSAYVTRAQLPLFNAIPIWTAFIDPGPNDETGLCGIILRGNAKILKVGETYDRAYVAITEDFEAASGRFARWCVDARQHNHRPTLIIEEYRLYPKDANRQVGQTFPTSEAIGAFKWICSRSGGRVFELAAQVKQPTKGMITQRGIHLLGGSEHAKDAELLMWHYVLRYLNQDGGKIG